MEKILSICVPTYNRSGYLEKLLGNIRQQLKEFDLLGTVEVLVSDNASSDNTQDIAAKFSDIIHYNRNPENVGPDANFLGLFEMAQGKYIWLPGDDDEVRSDTVRYILNMISAHDLDYLYLKTAGPVIEAADRGGERVSNVELLKTVNIFTTFMTSQVVRASLIKTNIEEARPLLGGFMAYYKIFLEALWRSKCCIISSGREVYANEDNTGGYSFYRVWGSSVFDAFAASSFGTDREILSVMKQRMFLTLILPITYKLRTGVKGFHFVGEQPEDSMRKYFDGFLYKKIFSAYMHAPIWVLSPLNRLMKIVASLSLRASHSII
jgi:glycosyltransferase involved in cell wall biosynthesis